MRLLVAPDTFAGTLTAAQAASAIAEGWHRRAASDELDLAPMSDGGPGFLDAVRAARGGELFTLPVRGPYGEELPGTVLVAAGTAYVEAAQACGLHLTTGDGHDPERATSYGVGELVAAAVDSGAERVVVGLGGCGTNDGGAGLLAALGATATPPSALEEGATGLTRLTAVDLSAAHARCAAVELVAAADVDSPLLGLIGTTNVHGTRRGIAEDRVQAVDAALERLATATDRRTALAKRAGAGGGLGFALLLLGADLRPGVGLVADTLRLPERAAAADLVVTGEAAFDFSSRSGTVPYAVAEVAAAALRPCIALAGAVLVGAREMRALGVESAYAVTDLLGDEALRADPYGSLSALAERVARTWSRG